MVLSRLPHNRGASRDAQTIMSKLAAIATQPGQSELTAMIVLTIVLAVLVGMSLGLLGGGGTILTVPLLTYVAGLDAKHAIAMSLLVVGVTSATGAITHARARRVRWRVAGVFGLAAMTGAYAGGRLAHFVPGTALLSAFAVIMISAGVAMLRSRKDTAADGNQPLPMVKITLLGVTVGLISGLVGAGGGFLLVPALALLTGLAMPVAVGTSLVVISVQSFAALAGHLATERIDWRLGAMVTMGAVVGAVVGGRLSPTVDPKTLRTAFGWMVLFMASPMLAQEVHQAIGAAAAGLTLVAGGMAVACARYAHCPLRRFARSRISASHDVKLHDRHRVSSACGSRRSSPPGSVLPAPKPASTSAAAGAVGTPRREFLEVIALDYNIFRARGVFGPTTSQSRLVCGHGESQ
jgi:uncharacterized protein